MSEPGPPIIKNFQILVTLDGLKKKKKHYFEASTKIYILKEN